MSLQSILEGSQTANIHQSESLYIMKQSKKKKMSSSQRYVFGLIGIGVLAVIFYSFVVGDPSASALPKAVRDQFSYISNMTYNLEPEFWEKDEDIKTKSVTLRSFYCAKVEVTNQAYRLFLGSLKANGKMEEWEMARIDSTKNYFPTAFGEPMRLMYHLHPAYNNFPAINVPYKGALLYCEWLEQELNEQGNGSVTYKVALPTREQWVAAAKGGIELMPYPWGSGLIDENGCHRAQYNPIGAESIHFNQATDSFEVRENSGPIFVATFNPWQKSKRRRKSTCEILFDLHPNSSHSFQPNGFGLFNMSGNVAEMVLEEGIACGGGWLSPGGDIRCVSTLKYEEPRMDVGFRPIIQLIDKEN